MCIERPSDAFGRPAGIGIGSDYSVEYGYDEYGRFSSVTANFGNEDHVATYAYLPGSHLVSGYSFGNITRAVTFDAARDLVAGVENTYSQTVISKFEYTNDALGRRTGRLDSGTAFASTQTNAFGYNPRSEVESADMRNGLSSYEFDPIGNRVEAALPEEPNPIAYAANALNQYTSITGRAAPAHDLDGNMLDDGAGMTMAWDGENRLIQTVKDGQTVTYAYDHMSRRVSKTASNVTREYLYDGWNVFREVGDQMSEVSTNYYTWGLDLTGTLQGAGGVGGLLAVHPSHLPLGEGQGEGRTVFPFYDAHGNITEYVTSNGMVTAHMEYDAFGRAIVSAGTAPAPFGFSTKFTDAETGLVYYGYRYYNPELGRWISRDPIGEWGGVNLCGFVDNNPAGRIDLLGLSGNRNDPPSQVSMPCCGGQVYDSSASCCIDGVITSREPQSTGVTAVTEYGRTDPYFNKPRDWLVQHAWIEFPGGSTGFGPNGNPYWPHPGLVGYPDGSGGSRGQRGRN